MTDTNRPPRISNLLAEGVLIVASILIAFALDAWWQERQESVRHRTLLKTLLSEFVEARSQLELQVVWLEESLNGTIRILEIAGPNGVDITLAEFTEAFRLSMDVGLSTPQQPTLTEILSSGEMSHLAGTGLPALLYHWLTVRSDLGLDARHLERNREESVIDALVRVSAPLSVLARTTDFGLPASRFALDITSILNDPGFETVMTMRAIRSRLLIEAYQDAIRVADEIIMQLEDYM